MTAAITFTLEGGSRPAHMPYSQCLPFYVDAVMLGLRKNQICALFQFTPRRVERMARETCYLYKPSARGYRNTREERPLSRWDMSEVYS